jgi:hypothetical protein
MFEAITPNPNCTFPIILVEIIVLVRLNWLGKTVLIEQEKK